MEGIRGNKMNIEVEEKSTCAGKWIGLVLIVDCLLTTIFEGAVEDR